jgi:hypothetical protein
VVGLIAGVCLSFLAGRPMNNLGKRVLPLAFFAVLLAGCASPPPPPPVAPPPPPERTCQVLENTEVAGDMYVDGQVTRHITTTRCVTQ